ncbi:hypothetical protein GMES_1156 [Paraglaciecola mesophila KMM 241]|uniref:Uncharacterized protein n=1 Tax=Paraglaciecola mesophila KMM 241 TaxID=1128912 RepID=K6ZJ98_9ALTE|nr:hypothetical protein GMES_1156 [Paraglaciecola mesophila KMM 241]
MGVLRNSCNWLAISGWLLAVYAYCSESQWLHGNQSKASKSKDQRTISSS